ncbi:protein LNK1-like isoform X2 [Rutidosis leptorrhynchoides]|uniref:protein LNK1-like isoform X2 n=1 Tax=Rutidosis leptorrhynchoides TaxID=125765 RepID=UPI003A991E42
MSDLYLYELDDIIWDDFDRGDDHIVPHPTNAQTNRNSFEGDICKKPRHETTPVLSNTSNLDVSNTIFQDKAEGDSKPLDKKESPSNKPSGAFISSADGEIVTDINSASDDATMSNNCFKSSQVTSRGDFCVDDHVLNGTPAAGDNNFYRYPQHVMAGDLLDYGWPDMGNLEDVDKMLRSCDSSFGLGVTSNDDELGWFTSDPTEATEEALKMDFKFPSPEPSGLTNILMDNDSPESKNHKSGCNSESKDELNTEDQKKQSKVQYQTAGNQSGQGITQADGSYYQKSDLTSHDNLISSSDSNNQVYTSVGSRQQYRNLEPNYFGRMQRNTTYLPSDYTHQTTVRPMVTGDPSRHSGMMFQSSESVLVLAENEGRLSKNELEHQSDMEGAPKRADIGSFNAPENSLEATSFRQLQQIMEQLDLRTKLCIRDSLYRLARSAEQRHNNLDFGGPLMSERTNKCTGLMDMETDTNPIDRSVAHLLFHRPAESPSLPAPLPPKPHINHGSIAGPALMADKLVFQENFAAESDDKITGD